MNRHNWRFIFIITIILTIPCYLFAIGVHIWQGGSFFPTEVPSAMPTRTPINLTELALTDPSLIVTEIVASATLSPTPLGIGLTPIVPTISNGGGFSTLVPFFTATAIPTRFITQTPIPPAAATNTPVPQPTNVPTNPPPILLPPTNTPSP